MLAPYNPFATYTPKTLTVNVTASVTCSVELAFLSTSLPPRLMGADALTYDIQSPAGGTSLVYAGGIPTTTTRIDVGPGNAGSTSVQITVPTGQIVGFGSYSDTSVTANIFDKTGSALTPLKSVSLAVTGSVARACQFSSPGNATLDFTSAITNGMPRPSHVATVTFPDLSCTAPSLVRLSADAMKLAQPPASTAAFDSAINFRAIASFSGATATLDTTSASDAASSVRHTAAGATLNGSVRVDVNLLAGRPLLAGAYSSLLTLSIDPNP